MKIMAVLVALVGAGLIYVVKTADGFAEVRHAIGTAVAPIAHTLAPLPAIIWPLLGCVAFVATVLYAVTTHSRP